MTRRMRLGLLGATLCGTLAATSVWAEPTAQEVEEDNSTATTLVTPHKPWARPYARGTIRALFVVYTGPYDASWSDLGTRLREVIELRQRFDLQADAILICGKGPTTWEFDGGRLGLARAERLIA